MESVAVRDRDHFRGFPLHVCNGAILMEERQGANVTALDAREVTVSGRLWGAQLHPWLTDVDRMGHLLRRLIADVSA